MGGEVTCQPVVGGPCRGSCIPMSRLVRGCGSFDTMSPATTPGTSRLAEALDAPVATLDTKLIGATGPRWAFIIPPGGPDDQAD